MLKKKWWDNENPKNSIFIKFLVLRWRLRLRRRCFFQYLYNCLDFLLLYTFSFTAIISLINDFKFSVISVVKNALWIKYESCVEPEYRKNYSSGAKLAHFSWKMGEVVPSQKLSKKISKSVRFANVGREDKITFEVGGEIFTTYKSTLKQFPG